MSDKLSEIMAWKRREIAPLMRAVTDAELDRLNVSLPRPPSFASALRRSDERLAVIAEIKRRSPSAGEIKPGASSLDQAQRYRTAGADALSILTDEKYFGGTLDDLRGVTSHFRDSRPAPVTAKPKGPGSRSDNPLGVSFSMTPFASTPPCLRKDFMVHPVQVLQAREAGASAILVIVRALADEEIKVLAAAASAAGLDALFEVHNEADLERALKQQATLIGVNNRDLAVFKTDLALTERLIPQFPRAVTAISESGIFTGIDAARARAAGAHAILVGEALMKASDPAALIAEFRNH